MTKYQIGDIFHHTISGDYYLVENLITVDVVGDRTYRRYFLRNLTSNSLHEFSTYAVDKLDTLQKVA